MFLLWSLLASGCCFGRRVQEAFKKNRLSTNGRIKLLLFIQQMSTYYVPGAVVEAWDTSVNKTHTQNPCPSSRDDSKGDEGVLGVVADCTLKYFVLGWYQRQGDSLAETDKESGAYLGEEHSG